MTDESYCVSLGHRFRIPGMDAEDIAQEARIAMLTADPRYRLRKARQRVLDLLKRETLAGEFRTETKPSLVQLHESVPASDDVFDQVVARDLLRRALAEPRTDRERIALGRKFRGEPIRRGDDCYDSAWYRLRARLAA